MSEESRSLVIPGPTGDVTPQWWVQAYGPGVLYKTTLDMSQPDGRKQLLAALNDESDGSLEYLNTDLRMIGYTILPASKEIDGEIVEWVRCVVHLEGGGRVAFGSRGILKSLMLYSQLDRMPPWNPPLVKRLVSRPLANGRHWYALTDPPEAPKKSK